MFKITIKMIRKKKKKSPLPKIVYRQVADTDGTALNRAYDILFEEVIKLRENKAEEVQAVK